MKTTTNIFETNANVLVNPVNICGVMGKGLAAQFADRFPEMFTAYKAECTKSGINVNISDDDLNAVTDTFCKNGWLHVWQKGNTIIANLATKIHFKRDSYYPLISNSLKLLTAWVQKNTPASVAIPRLGTGNGHLDWDKVSSIILKEIQTWPTKTKVWIDGVWQKQKEETTMKKQITIWVQSPFNGDPLKGNHPNCVEMSTSHAAKENMQGFKVINPGDFETLKSTIAENDITFVHCDPNDVNGVKAICDELGVPTIVVDKDMSQSKHQTQPQYKLYRRRLIPRKYIVNAEGKENPYNIGVFLNNATLSYLVKKVIPIGDKTMVIDDNGEIDISRVAMLIQGTGVTTINGVEKGIFSLALPFHESQVELCVGTKWPSDMALQRVLKNSVRNVLLARGVITDNDEVGVLIDADRNSKYKINNAHIEGNAKSLYFEFNCAYSENDPDQISKRWELYLNKHGEYEDLRTKTVPAPVVSSSVPVPVVLSPVPEVKKIKRCFPKKIWKLFIADLVGKGKTVAEVVESVFEVKQGEATALTDIDGHARRVRRPSKWQGLSVTDAVKKGILFDDFIAAAKAVFDSKNPDNSDPTPVTPVTPEETTDEPEVETTVTPQDPAVEETAEVNIETPVENTDTPEEEEEDPFAALLDPNATIKTLTGQAACDAVAGKDTSVNNKSKDEELQPADTTEGDIIPDINDAPEEDSEDMSEEPDDDPVITEKVDAPEEPAKDPVVIIDTFKDLAPEVTAYWDGIVTDKFVNNYYPVSKANIDYFASDEEKKAIIDERTADNKENLRDFAGLFFGTSNVQEFTKGIKRLCDDIKCSAFFLDITADEDDRIICTFPQSFTGKAVRVYVEKHDDKLVAIPFQG